jgi:hypothetical protein
LTTTGGFLEADRPPPLVEVKLVSHWLRHERLHIRALQHDTSRRERRERGNTRRPARKVARAGRTAKDDRTRAV